MALARVSQDGLVLLGCGKMGSALLAGWLAAGIPAAAIWVLEPNPSDWLRGVGVHLNQGVPPRPAVAVLAVKPQMMGDALPALRALGNGTTLFISIAAGTAMATFSAALGADTPLVRAMPNTPAMVGRGITGLCGNDKTSPDDVALATALMASVGQVVTLEGEHQMDAVTAVSGSGPAYVFYMIEALAQAGAALGLGPDVAMQLARATVCGAGELAHQAADPAAQLRVNVTSPGGTTAAALVHLMDETSGLAPLMARAVAAAAARGKELSQ
jgi:pyrroline-5-carboxylate reductase